MKETFHIDAPVPRRLLKPNHKQSETPNQGHVSPKPVVWYVLEPQGSWMSSEVNYVSPRDRSAPPRSLGVRVYGAGRVAGHANSETRLANRVKPRARLALFSGSGAVRGQPPMVHCPRPYNRNGSTERERSGEARMSNRTGSVLSLALLVFALGCSQNTTEPTIHARRVRVVRTEPLVADLYRSVSFALTKRGQLYLAVPERHIIAVYDTLGRPVRDLGSEGEGPGEFLSPQQVAILGDGHLIVLDAEALRISSFDAEGQFVASRKMASSCWMACSDTLVYVVPGRKPHLFEVFGPTLRAVSRGGTDSFVEATKRMAFFLTAAARKDTLWVLYGGSRPPLLSGWLVNGQQLSQESIWPGDMARNVRAKEDKAAEAVRQGRIPAGGGWVHTTGVVVDPKGRIWVQYYWVTEDDSLKTVFYVYDRSLRLRCRVVGFAGCTVCPVFDNRGRLWAIETPSKWGTGTGETVLAVYFIPGVTSNQAQVAGEKRMDGET